MWKSTELRVTPGFFLLLALAAAWGAGEVLPHVLLSALCHELGHLLMLWCVGVCPQRITLHAGGVEIRAAGQEKLSYGGEILCVLAGPAVNLALAVLFARVSHDYLFAGANAILAVYNLLPIRNLDGGRLLYLTLAWCTDPFFAQRLADGVNLVTMGMLLGIGCVILIRTGSGLFCLAGGVGLLLGQVFHRRGKRGCQTEQKQIQ